MNWDWHLTRAILPQLLRALITTAEVSLLASLIALFAGLAIAAGQRSHSALVRLSIGWLAELIRRTPLLLQLYALFYVLPFVGIVLSPFVAGILGLGLHCAAYAAEAYRAGVDAVPRGQWDAARACNLSTWETWRQIILPQAIPIALPSLANLILALFKISPLVSALGLIELMGRAREIANFEYRYLEPMTLVGVLFLLFGLPAAIGVRRLEKFLTI